MEKIQGFSGMRVFALVWLVAPGLFGQAPLPGSQVSRAEDPLSKGEDLYRRTEYQASLTLVRESGQTSGQAYCLMGRDHFMLGDYKKATAAFEQAFRIDPTNSEFAHWLGRGFGRRAETSAPFFTAAYAAKAREYFKKAVALDPNNQEAMRDLFDYYLEAPGFRGEGYDKAAEIAQRIAQRSSADGRLAQAELAERRKQFDTVEERLGRAMLGPRPLSRWLDRARSLARQGRVSEMLNRYLRSNPTPGDRAREEAEKLLKEASGA